MNSSTEETQGRLRAVDPDLPMLSAQAAIELDNLRLNRGSGLEAVNKLASRLKNSFQSQTGSGTRKSFLDASTMIIVGRALDLSRIGSRTTEVTAKIQDALSVATRLESVGQETPPKDLEELRNFCTALAKYAASYRRSIHDLKPSHPFRR